MSTERTKRMFADPPPWWDLAPLIVSLTAYTRLRRAGLAPDEITAAARELGYNGVEIEKPARHPA